MPEIAERSSGPFKRELDTIARGAKGLDAVRLARRLTDTDAAHALKVAKAAREHSKDVTDALNRVAVRFSEERAAIDRRAAEKANLKPDPAWHQAIAMAFAALPGKDRLARLAELSEQGRGTELAAILDAPPSITGLSAEQCAAYRAGFIQEHAKAELEERDALDAAMEAFSAATRASSQFVKELIDPGQLAAIERADSEADAAEMEFAAGHGPQ